VYSRSKKKLIGILIFVIVIIAAWNSGLHKYLSLEAIRANTLFLQEQVQQQYWRTVLLYILTYMVIVISCVPGAGLMSIIGGFLFGVIPAILYINIAAVGGALIFFLCVRHLIGSFLQAKYHARLARFNEIFEQKGWLFLLLLRCMPLIPFFMVNLFAALTRVSTRTFTVTTSLGVIPSSILFSFAGKKLGTVTAFKDLFSYEIFAVFGALLVLLSIPFFISNRYKQF
jgi:uncharacterized membrane protein YdjX (TVP38/TMEM64 family)